MMNLNINVKKLATRKGVLEGMYLTGCITYSVLRKNGFELVATDRYRKVAYFVVNYRERITTEDEYFGKIKKDVVTMYDLKDPVMVSTDRIAAIKSFDFLRGQKQKVALLCVDPFQKVAATHARNGVVRLERSGLMELKVAKDGKTAERQFAFFIENDEGHTEFKRGSGFDLIDNFERGRLLSQLHEVEGDNGKVKPETQDLPNDIWKFSISRALVITESSMTTYKEN